MSAIVSLRFLTEPAYALVGAVLPDDGSGEVRLLVSSDAVVAYPAEARPLLEYLSVLRGRSELLGQLAEWEAEPSDLDELVGEGLLLQLPPNDEQSVREALAGLTLRINGDAGAAADGQSVLLQLPTNRAVDISLVTAAVLNAPVIRTLGASVRDLAQTTAIPEDDIWRSVLHDLTAVLTTGAGNLVRVGAEP